MKFGVSLGRVNPGLWADVTVEGERLGFDSVWVPEHLVLPAAMAGSPFADTEHPPVPPTTPVFDAAAYLSFLAARTSTIKLGTWVYLLGIRHPFVSARAFATLDVLSQGRAIVGIGAGWLESEWQAIGLDFKTRGRRLDEAIAVCRRLWTEEVVEHSGQFFEFGPVMFEPKPPQQPIPVHVGGESEPALHRAVNAGDGWLGMLHDLASVAPLVTRLRDERGDDFEITVGTDALTEPDDVGRWEEVGVDRLIVAPWRRSSGALDGLKQFAERMLR